MSREVPVSIAWFGKVPSRGDFVRSQVHGALTQMIDTWLTQGLDQLSTDPRWKQIYDQGNPSSFAFLGIHSRVGLAGHLIPSVDASGRRFPFVATGSFSVETPQSFLPAAPVAMTTLWNALEGLGRRACAAEDLAPVLAEASQWMLSIETDERPSDAQLGAFVESQTLGSFQSLLQANHPAVDLRQILLALGLLLQPVPSSGVSRLDKGLRLPLPGDPLYQSLVASWWLHLITPFISRGDFELLIFIPRAAAAQPVLSIGFAGGSASTLLAMLDDDRCDDALITLDAPDWVESHCNDDYGLRKLSSYLQQPQLSLVQASRTFNECFLGT